MAKKINVLYKPTNDELGLPFIATIETFVEGFRVVLMAAMGESLKELRCIAKEEAKDWGIGDPIIRTVLDKRNMLTSTLL